jgi:cysteine desulfurase family protein
MIYLNNAATSWPKAPGVIEAVAEGLTRMPEYPGRSAYAEFDPPEECRMRLARMLGTEQSERIVLTTNATHALNLAILGLGLKPGDEVVTSVTEHNSMFRPLARLEDVIGLRVTAIGMAADGSLDEEAFEQALLRSPRLVAFNHASNVTGRILPVAAMFARARQAGAVTLLDASQSLGHLPVNVRELNADMIAFTGHKGLRGPSGTGGLYVAPGVKLEQVVVGGTGVRSDLRLHPPEMPTRLEAGTLSLPDLAGLAAALRWREEQEGEFVAIEAARAERLRTGMRDIPRVRLFGDADKAPGTGIVSFRVEGWNVEETGYALAVSFGIVCRTGLHCAPMIHAALGSAPEGTVRFSPSGATTEDEIETALKSVWRLAA